MSATNIEITVHYCETGDSQHLCFKTAPSYANIQQEIKEYAESGLCLASLVLLQTDGSFLTSKSPPLSSNATLYIFSRAIIDNAFTSKALQIPTNSSSSLDPQIARDLAENLLQRIAVQNDAGKLLVVHAQREMDRHSFERLGRAVYAPYESLMREDFDKIASYLEQLTLVQTSAATTTAGPKKTLLDAINLDKFHSLANLTQQRHEIIENKMRDVQREDALLRKELQEIVWEQAPAQLTWEPATLDLAALQVEWKRTSLALFALLRRVALFDNRVQNLKKNLFFLQEHVAVQRQFLNEVHKIKLFPQTYAACLEEAARRRQFALRFSAQLNQVSQFLAKDRDRELELREAFYQSTLKLLPVPGLIPGLDSTGVLPPVEINQKPIDPLLFSSAERAEEDAAVVMAAEPETRAEQARGLSAIELLEMQAENELLRGMEQGGSAFAAFKQAHREEVAALERRIQELEEFSAKALRSTAVLNDCATLPPMNGGGASYFEEDAL